jgi:hypothetical protein
MSEHLNPEELHVPIIDQEAVLAINGLEVVFSTKDTAFWRYRRPEHKMFDHITRWHEEDGSYNILFGADDEDYQKLAEAGITGIDGCYPTEDVISFFWATEMAHYDAEVADWENGDGES